MRRVLLLVTVAAVMAAIMVVMAAPAFADRRQPGIGGPPPGFGERNPNAGDNPGTHDRTSPRTGGIRFAETCDKPASFCG